MRSGFIEKIGSIGTFLTALLTVLVKLTCPACFPLFAAVSAALGLGVLQPFEGIAFVLFKLFVLIALIGNVFAYLKHRKVLPLAVGVLGPILIFLALYAFFHSALLYTGLFALLLASILNFFANRQCPSCKPKEANL